MLFNHSLKRVEEHPLVRHKGIFRRELTLFQAIALIVGGTIGAGVLGIPYAISRVGVGVGVSYIIVLGFLMLGLNLLIGEVVARTKGEFHIAGLARIYLGRVGEVITIVLFYLFALGVLVVYMIGVGQSLSQIFGGASFWWSIGFLLCATSVVAVGLRLMKTIDFFLSFLLLGVIILIIALSAPHITPTHLSAYDITDLLLPYGVILFALSSPSTIPEAHAVLGKKNLKFKLSIAIAGILVMVAYTLFAFVTVGVTGSATTEIATIGLGQVLGRPMVILGNVFAIIAMSMGFLMTGLVLRDSLVWDYKLPPIIPVALVSIVPLVLFLLGLRSFIVIINVLGGVVVSAQMILLVLICWRAKNSGHLLRSRYHLHHAMLLIVVLLTALMVGAGYSMVKLF